jgi:plastocyanin
MNSTNSTGTNVPVVHPPSRPRRGPGKWLIVGILVLMVGIASVLTIQNRDKQGVQAEPVATVEITDTAFVPATIKIKQSESVTWINTGTQLHQVAADPYPSRSKLPSLFSEESLTSNESYNFSFDKKGTYTYHDPLNPTILKGTVIVE